MNARTWAVAALATLALAPPAFGASASVDVRAEGSSRTWAEAPVVNDGFAFDGGDETGRHACDGTNNGASRTPGPTATAALVQALRDARVPFRARFFGDFEDFFFEQIGDDRTAAGQAGARNWLFYVNGRAPAAGGCQTRIDDGDDVMFAFTTGMEPILVAEVSEGDTVAVGETLDLRVFEFSPAGQRSPAAGASIGGRTTEEDGTVSLTFPSAGVQTLKASRDGSIRSNEVRLCVHPRGEVSCPGFDRTAPVISISSPAERALRRAPERIRGAARDRSGLRSLAIAIERVRGRRCQTLSPRTRRFSGSRPCGRARPSRISTRVRFGYRIPVRLGRGSYRVAVRATDRVGNAGTERIAFSVR